MKQTRQIAELITGIRDIHFEVYKTYMLQETRQKYSEVLLVYRNFFSCDLRAHFAAMMVTLGRIFDKNTKYVGIPGLLQRAPELKSVARDKLDRVHDLWNGKRIMLLRHQVVAHRSSGATAEDIFAIVKTSLNELGELIKLL